MVTQTKTNANSPSVLGWTNWTKIGLVTALFSVTAVLVIQALALLAWPEIAQFKPLDSYLRTVLFTLVPALSATAIFAWLVKRGDRPVRKFLALSAVVLLLSFIPDYALPFENKSLLGSTVAAFMHLVAGVTIITALVASLPTPDHR